MEILEPLIRLTQEIAANFGNRDIKYLVGQVYRRREILDETNPNTPILFTPYTELWAAKQHLGDIKRDKLACIVDLGVKKHVLQLMDMLIPPTNYESYFAKCTDDFDVKMQASRMYREKIFSWLATNQNVHINPNEHIHITFGVTRGQIYLSIKINFKPFTIPLAELEELPGTLTIVR